MRRGAIIPALIVMGAIGCRRESLPPAPPPRPLATYTFPQYVESFALNRDGARAAVTCGSGNEVHVVDFANGAELATLATSLIRRAGPPNLGVSRAIFSPDGKYIAAAGWHGCELWRLEDKTLSHAWVIRNVKPVGFVYSPSGRYLYIRASVH